MIICDEDTGKRINLADNRLSDIGDYDHRMLAELLADLEDTCGTGYDPQDIDNLATLVADEGWDDDAPGSSGLGEPDEVNGHRELRRVGRSAPCRPSGWSGL